MIHGPHPFPALIAWRQPDRLFDPGDPQRGGCTRGATKRRLRRRAPGGIGRYAEDTDTAMKRVTLCPAALSLGAPVGQARLAISSRPVPVQSNLDTIMNDFMTDPEDRPRATPNRLPSRTPIIDKRRRLPTALAWLLLAATCGRPILHAQGDPSNPVAFRNPTPIYSGEFGQSIAPVGTDFIVVGEWANTLGGAHLFRTNGTFVRKFPTRSSGFGSSVAGVGTDRVLIGAPHEPRGTAYLLNTQGTLQATLNPPAGGEARYFGWSVAEVGEGLLQGLRNEVGHWHLRLAHAEVDRRHAGRDAGERLGQPGEGGDRLGTHRYCHQG